MSPTLAKWSIADYHRIIDAGILDDRRVELIAGDIVEMVPESPEHTYREQSLADMLRKALGDRACVREDKPVTFADSEPEPDIAIARGTARDYLDRHPAGRDLLLVIEISKTTLQNDLTTKHDLYARAGIPEYWVVNLRDRCVAVFRGPEGGTYAQEQAFEAGAIAPIAFSDCQIRVEDIFA